VQSGIDTPVTPPIPPNNINHGTTHTRHAKPLPNPQLERFLDNVRVLPSLPLLFKEPLLLQTSPLNNVYATYVCLNTHTMNQDNKVTHHSKVK